MNLIATLKAKIDKAESEGRKVAAIHSEILIHADEIREYIAKNSSDSLCASLGIPKTYKYEISKMLAASLYLHSEGILLSRHKE